MPEFHLPPSNNYLSVKFWLSILQILCHGLKILENSFFCRGMVWDLNNIILNFIYL
jgi:hypothetical protein